MDSNNSKEQEFEVFKKSCESIGDSCYLFFANILITKLESKLAQEIPKYSLEDLMDYTFLEHYLQYNRKDDTLLLALTIHQLLFLHNSLNS